MLVNGWCDVCAEFAGFHDQMVGCVDFLNVWWEDCERSHSHGCILGKHFASLPEMLEKEGASWEEK